MTEISDSDVPRLISWTGERCVPWTNDVRVVYEHYHRYALAARFVRGKRVLDLACGEGFGAAMLAAAGAEVVGLDIDSETVEHANRNYGGRDVRFRAGTITDPKALDDENPFDVIVCFEAIEHVDDHPAVLRLVRAKLAQGGLFFASTPDTAIYHDQHGNENPFHLKELSASQFGALLDGSFRHTALLNQNVAIGSLMTPADPGDLDTAVDGVRLQTLRKDCSGGWAVEQGVPHTYLLGIASDRQLPTLPAVAVLVDAGLDPAPHAPEAGEVIDERDAAVADVARLNELYQRSRAEADKLKSTIERLESLREEETERADEGGREQERLRSELDRLGSELHNATQTAERDAARIEWQRETLTRLESGVTDAERRAEELAVTNAELAEQNSAPVQRAVTRYRRVIERVAPRGTTRRDVYELALGREPGAGHEPNRPVESGPVSVPCSDDPVVSVIVAVHGKWPYTRQCLRFLGDHLVSVPFEVIVVDDASPDDSASRLAACEGVRLIHAERDLGFVGACNLGAEHARGEHLFFLDNAAEITESWLDVLVRTVDSDERIGLVGAKLVHPDGRLQGCGSIVWSDGTGWNLGRDGDPDAAEYNVMRDVDYCSGAAVLVRTRVFREVGGFDERYAPAYYEDTDLAFAVRAAGYRTVVQPRAVVVHHEGVSNGTDTGSGVRKHQELNRRSFLEKWAETLVAEHLPEATARNLWLARNRGTRGHFGPLVLVKDHQVPRPDFDSGSGRMRRVLRQLVELGCRVVFFPHDHARLEPYTTDLQQVGVTVLPEPRLQQAFLEEAGSEITMAVLSRPQVAWSLVEHLRVCAPQCTVVYDSVDVRFLRLERQAALVAGEGAAGNAEALRHKAYASRQMEIGLVRSCDVTLVVSEVERELLRELTPESDVRVLSNVYEVEWRSASAVGRGDVVFVGSFEHQPNADAVGWAVREIMPLVRQRCPEVVLHVVGSFPTDEVLRFDGHGVEVHGWLPDLVPMYARSRVMLAPLRFGAGVRGKVGECLAAGVPAVGTTLAMEGMHLEPERDVVVADDAQGLADGLVRLLTDDAEWQRLSAAGKSRVATQFGPDACKAILAELLKSSA